MIKVIQVLTDTNIGGAGIWLLNFMRAYDRTKIDMSVVLPKRAMLKEKLEELNVRIIEADGIDDTSFSVEGIKALDAIFKEENPDIVHTHASLSARIAARMNKINVVNTRHCLEEEKRFIKKFIYRLINNYLSDCTIGVSRAVCENLEDDGISPDKIRLVYNGIFPTEEVAEDKKAMLRAKYGISDNSVVVGIIARLEPVKNHEMFLEAAKVIATICPEAVFMVVGSGSMETALKRKALRDKIADKVIFTGYIEDVRDIMNIIDIHVLTSQKEALSLSLIEAMSLKKPVVATNSGGVNEVVSDRLSGILVNTEDTLNLAMGIVKLIQHKDLRISAGEQGEKIVKEKFLAENMARAIEDIYIEFNIDENLQKGDIIDEEEN